MLGFGLNGLNGFVGTQARRYVGGWIDRVLSLLFLLLEV